MRRPSSIDKLPQAIREEIGRLRMEGCTLDEILKGLQALAPATPSRSALGRYVMRMDALGEKMRHSREIAEALVSQLGDAPGTKAAQLNVELLHCVVMDLMVASAEGEEGIDPDAAAALHGNPEGVMFLAKALDHLAKANKSNADLVAAAEKRAADKATKAAASVVERVGKQHGVSAQTLALIKQEIFGVKAGA